MDDFVVSCWPIPVRNRESFEKYRKKLERISYAFGGALKEDEFELFIEVDGFKVYPSDVLCRYASGRWGVRRGGK